MSAYYEPDHPWFCHECYGGGIILGERTDWEHEICDACGGAGYVPEPGRWQRSGCVGVDNGDHLGWPFQYWSRDGWGWVLMHATEDGEAGCVSEGTDVTFPDECTADEAMEAGHV